MKNREQLFLLFLALYVCSCRSPKVVETKPGVLEAVAQAVDTNYNPGKTALSLRPEEKTQLQGIQFSDPLVNVHPRYIDRVKSVEHCQVERSYLNYTGEVSRTEVVTLPEDEFWEPLKLLAQYYSKFGRLPTGASLSVPVLKVALAQKAK